MKTLSGCFPIFTTRGIIFQRALGTLYGGVSLFHTVFQIIKNRNHFFVTTPRPEPPECLTDQKFDRHSYVECNNVKLHYVSNGDPNKPLMLFLHGFPECWYTWKNQIPEFSKNYFTVALSMRGYGDSDKPKGVANYSLGKLVDDVKEFVHALGKEKCILVSHDWGGFVGWTVAAHYPELVDKFIVCNGPNVKQFKHSIESDWEQFKKMWYLFFFNMPFLPELNFRCNDYKQINSMFKKFLTKEEIECYKYYFCQPYGLSGPINYYRALLRGHSKDFLQEVMKKRLICETLIIWGKNDLALISRLAEMCGQCCDNYTIKMIDNCSHFTPLDAPDLVNKYINEFLTK